MCSRKNSEDHSPGDLNLREEGFVSYYRAAVDNGRSKVTARVGSTKTRKQFFLSGVKTITNYTKEGEGMTQTFLNNYHLLQIQKLVRETRDKRIVLVGWRLSCYLNHRVVQLIHGVSAIIDLAFNQKTDHGYRGVSPVNRYLNNKFRHVTTIFC